MRRRRIVRAGAVLVVFGAALAYYALFVSYGVNFDDEGTLLAQIYRTAQGEVPYRDFHMGYTPGGHYYHAWLMQLFGPSTTPLRWSLAVCNALVAALLFVIGRRAMPSAFALLPPAASVAMMQVYPGDFATFNIPYPAWYTVLFGVAGFWMLLCYIESRRLVWIAAAGLVTGLCFAFKPNVGLFQLAGSGLVLLMALEPPADGRAPRWQGAVWWLLLVGIVAGLFGVFASQASRRDVSIFLWPILVLLATLAVRRLMGRSADQPRHELLASGLLYMVPLLLAVVPWVVVFLQLIGPDRFARQILFIGTGFERYYYTPFHVMGRWDVHLVRATLLLAVIGIAVRARWVRPAVLATVGVAGMAAATLVAIRAEMPQGLHAAVFSRIEDLSFTGSLLMHWVGLAALLPLVWASHRSHTQRTQVAILVGALAMYLQLYPRSDFTHLVNAVPLTLVVGAGLLARFTAWFPEEAGIRRSLRMVLVTGLFGLCLFRVWPGISGALRWENGPQWRPHAALALERLPIHLELGREPRLLALHDTVEYLRANTQPGEAIFPFPSIELLCFLADRPNATRHGYFFPGWPGRDVEAEVTATLRLAPPRFVVVLQTHPYFFLKAPVYYFSLRELVRTRYRQVASFREYAVLARRDVADGDLVTPPPAPRDAEARLEALYGERLRGAPEERLRAARTLEVERLDFPWADATQLLADPSPQVRSAGIVALSGSSDANVAAVLAQALQRDQVPPQNRLAVLRRLWATGDARVIRPVLDALPRLTDDREQNAALGGLEAIGRKLAISDHWFGDWRPPDVREEDLGSLRELRRRLADPTENQTVRIFLANVLPRLGRRNVAPALWIALGSSDSDLRNAAVAGLMRLQQDGRGIELVDVLLPQIVKDPYFVPSMVLELYKREPRQMRRRLLKVLRSEWFVFDQIAVTWLVAATGDPYFRDELVRLVASPARELRLAALAGLGHIADPATRPAIAGALDDPDYTVRDFAAQALAALPAP